MTNSYAQLTADITNHFSLLGLKEICLEIAPTAKGFAARIEKAASAGELVKIAIEMNQLDPLLKMLGQKQPSVDWLTYGGLHEGDPPDVANSVSQTIVRVEGNNNSGIQAGIVEGDVVAGDQHKHYHYHEERQLKTKSLLVPTKITDFVGRNTKIKRLKAKLCAGSPVFLGVVGMGGIGKTALANIVANELKTEKVFVDGVLWIDGRDQRTLDEIVDILAKHLSLDINPDSPLRDRLNQCLRVKKALLIVDNIDSMMQIDTSDANRKSLIKEFQNLASFLKALPIPVLVTSRIEPRHAEVFQLHPLSDLEAVSLFNQSTGLTDDELSDQDPEEIRELCSKDLGGHPFAIEVLGPLIADGLDVSEIREDLSQSPDEVLSIESADSGQTVIDVLRLSYQSLSEKAKNLLLSMSIFKANFNHPVLVAINSEYSRVEITGSIGELTKRSLLSKIERKTYSLHPLTRQFAYQKLLKSKNPHEIHRRTADYFMTTSDLNTVAAMEHYLKAEDIQKAIKLALEHGQAWVTSGKASEGLAACKEFSLDTLSIENRIGLLETMGDLHYLGEEIETAITHFSEAITESDRAFSTMEIQIRVRLRRKLAAVLLRRGNPQGALDNIAQAQELFLPETNLIKESAQLLTVKGDALLHKNQYDQAKRVAQSALDDLGHAATPLIKANLYDVLGKADYFKGDFVSSQHQFDMALTLRGSLDESRKDQQSLIKSYSNLAIVYGQTNQYDQALQANQKALEIAERIGDSVALLKLSQNMAIDYFERGLFEPALDQSKQALESSRRMGTAHVQYEAHLHLGKIYRHKQEFDSAMNHLTAMDSLAEQIVNQHVIISGLREWAEFYLAQGEIADAKRYESASSELAKRTGDDFFQAYSCDVLGRIYHKEGNYKEAADAFGQAKTCIRNGKQTIIWLGLYSIGHS